MQSNIGTMTQQAPAARTHTSIDKYNCRMVKTNRQTCPYIRIVTLGLMTLL